MSNVAVSVRQYTISVSVPRGIQGPSGNAEKSGCVMVSGAESGSLQLSTGDSKAVIRVGPEMDGMNLTAVGASVSNPSSAGAVSVQMRRVRGGVSADMLSTAITIDENETDTITAATAAVIDTTSDDVETGDQVHIDIDSAGTNVLGLVVSFTFENPL